MFQQWSGGRNNISVEADDLTGVLEALENEIPGISEHIQDQGGPVKRYVNVYLNDENINNLNDLDTRVNANDNILILPAIAGG